MTRRPNDTESCATAAPPLKVWTERAGALLRLRLDLSLIHISEPTRPY